MRSLGSTELLSPKGICASEDGRYLFVCDSGHHKIKFAALPATSALASVEELLAGVDMFVFAGNGKKAWRDGPVLDCSFNSPTGVCQRADGTIVVADTGNNCIRHIVRSAKGALVARTIAGGLASYRVSGQNEPVVHSSDSNELRQFLTRSAGYRDGHRALFRSPSDVVEGPLGELLVTDTMNNCIRGLLPPSDGGITWIVHTVCGVVGGGYVDGSCEVAAFRQPMSLCMGPRGTFFVSDRGNRCVRQVGGCLAQHSDRCSDSLSYTWVRTIEVGVIPRSVLDAPVATLQECAVEHLGYPLGVLHLRADDDRSPSHPVSERSYDSVSTLVVCDGGSNVIEFLSLGNAVKGGVGITSTWNPDLRLQTRQRIPATPVKPSSSPFRSMCSSFNEIQEASEPAQVAQSKRSSPEIDSLDGCGRQCC